MVRPYPSNKDYLISDKGYVYSLKTGGMRPIKRYLNINGYYNVNLYCEGIRQLRYVHTMVLETFVSPRPEGLECRHLDGNPLNNHISNLTWGTRSENLRDRGKHGFEWPCGEGNGSSKLTEVDVRTIRNLLSDTDMPLQEIGNLFDVSYGAIHGIATERNWRHVQ